MILHLGVNDVPEPASDLTTYQVGKILEDQYGLFSAFYEMNKELIDNEVAKHLKLFIENPDAEMPAMETVYLDAVKRQFQIMLETRSFDGKLTGVPTKAATTGYSRIKKKASERKSKRPVKAEKASRPSFVDSHTLKNSLRIWID